jgi:hypothetical protein
MMFAEYDVPKATRGRVRTPKALRAKSTRNAGAVLRKLSECDASSHRFYCRSVIARGGVMDLRVVSQQ